MVESLLESHLPCFLGTLRGWAIAVELSGVAQRLDRLVWAFSYPQTYSGVVG